MRVSSFVYFIENMIQTSYHTYIKKESLTPVRSQKISLTIRSDKCSPFRSAKTKTCISGNTHKICFMRHSPKMQVYSYKFTLLLLKIPGNHTSRITPLGQASLQAPHPVHFS